MALSDKDILITPNIGQTDDPKIEFKGADSTTGPQTITARVYPTSNGTLSFEGSAGQLFSITNDFSGTIFSVNDVSGIPSIEVKDDGTVTLAEYSGNVGIGTSNPDARLQAYVTGLSGSATNEVARFTCNTTGVERSVSISAPGNTSAYGKISMENTNFPLTFWVGGSEAMRIVSSGNVGIGTDSASQKLDVNGDAAIHGVRVGRGPGAISTNTAVGSGALDANTTGSENTATGYQALYSNTEGDGNVATGRNALLSNTTGNSNTANGYQALRDNTIGNNNTVTGYEALFNNTTGNGNTANGHRAFYSNTTGGDNTGVGRVALFNNTTGVFNTAIGLGAGSNITTGRNNTCVGHQAAASSATVSDEITLGNSSVTALRCNTTVITALSDARDKTDVVPLPVGIDFIQSLRPVSFTWNQRDGGRIGNKDFGFIAQELLEAQKNLGITVPNLVNENNPDRLEAGYAALIPVMVQAIKDLKSEIETLKGN